jgi:hypothetical protein
MTEALPEVGSRWVARRPRRDQQGKIYTVVRVALDREENMVVQYVSDRAKSPNRLALEFFLSTYVPIEDFR